MVLPRPTLRRRLRIYLTGLGTKGKVYHKRSYETISTLCEWFLVVHNCICFEIIQLYRLNNTATATLILLPEKYRQHLVRLQQSSGLDLMLFASAARSNLPGILSSYPVSVRGYSSLAKYKLKRINTDIT